MKKLTLTAEKEIIDLAKKLAEARGTSVSAMFSQLIRALAEGPSQRGDKVGPITRRVTGIARARNGKSDRQLIEDSLLERHGT
ncbi:MAG: DUF6364 family protein [Tepidisphaeraceae bacterium]|jgi:hypothetical protein